MIDNIILEKLSYQNITNTSKWLWLLLNSEEKDKDGFFHLCQREFAEKLSISRRQLIKYLNDLDEKHLIEKDLRTTPVAGDRARRRLFIKIRKLETVNNMTFFATFERISEDQKIAYFKDIYNVIQDIHFNQLELQLDKVDYNLQALKRIDVGSLIVFNACIQKENDQTKKIVKIWNIKDRATYYDS